MNIRLYFLDMWEQFDFNDNPFVDILKLRHNVTIDSENPNLVISTNRKVYPNALFLYYNVGEPYYPIAPIEGNILDPKREIADHFLGSFFFDFENYTRFSLYNLYMCHLVKNKIVDGFDFFYKTDREIPQKDKFCCFVGGVASHKRGRFIEKLNKYKLVETNARPYNHFSLPFDNTSFSSSIPKVNILRRYKFNLAFENNARGNHPAFFGADVQNGELEDMGGLTNEKILEPFVAGTIPLYWGNKRISEEFNSKTFLNLHDFKNEDEFIDKIVELDSNDDLYKSYFSEQIAANNNFSIEHLADLFDNILFKYKNEYFND